jgi:hypothetical protein
MSFSGVAASEEREKRNVSMPPTNGALSGTITSPAVNALPNLPQLPSMAMHDQSQSGQPQQQGQIQKEAHGGSRDLFSME